MRDLLRPTYILNNIEELPFRADITSGIKLVALDVDGTIADYHALPDEAAREAMRQLGDMGLYLCLLSNAYGDRVDELNDEIGKPFAMPVIAPAVVTPAGENPKAYRKPSAAMPLYAARIHGVRPNEMLVVGDQLFKDVVCANRAGAKGALLPRRGEGDHPGVKLQRFPEMLVRRALGVRFEDNV